jgi:hypothetical protein
MGAASLDVIARCEAAARDRGATEARKECAKELEAALAANGFRAHGGNLARLVTRWRGGEPAATVEERVRAKMPCTARLAKISPAEVTPDEAAQAEAGER